MSKSGNIGGVKLKNGWGLWLVFQVSETLGTSYLQSWCGRMDYLLAQWPSCIEVLF